MDSGYLRTLAYRCRKSARDCFDLYAKEEFRHLASELDMKADELELAHNRAAADARSWQPAKSSGAEEFRR